jgi:hypothetical protein
MTKHVCKIGRLTGIVLAGELTRYDIREAFKKYKDPFDNVIGTPGVKETYSACINHPSGSQVMLTASYEASPYFPRNIVISVLDISGLVDERTLCQYLDCFINKTGIREIESYLDRFHSEPLMGWSLLAGCVHHL